MTFQFLRPEWLLLLIPLIALLWLLWNRSGSGRDWESVVDPALLPHLLVGKNTQRQRWPLLVFVFAGLLALTALAGPVWKKLPLPVFKQQSALVIALDLSTSMDAADIKPSRLTRARLKLKDLLSRRSVGQTALIAYAASPYTVTPLTDDTDTIQSLVSSLTTELMPAQGSRADLAIAKAVELFRNAGLDKGDILLITDAVNEKSQRQIEAMDVSGYRVSVLAVGSAEGAPVAVPGSGYVTDSNGSIVIAKTNFAEMRMLASNLGGLYSPLTIDDADLKLFDTLLAEHDVMSEHQKTEFKADRWQEEGPWLLLLVIPLAALVFRRGLILVLVLMVMTLPVPQPALAQGWQWDQLWKNRDQRAREALEQGAAGKAAKLFEQRDWKAAALYKAQQYEQALEQLEASKSSDASYNRGNILAKMGRLEEALESYDEVLQKHPQHEDAQYNREQVKKALEQQQQQQQQQGQQDKDSQQDQSSNEQNQQSEQSESESESQQPEQDSEQSSGEQQSSDSESSEDEQQNQSEQQRQKEEAERDLAEQEKKQQASQQEEGDSQNDKDSQTEAQAQMDMTEKLSEQAERQWLRRIPDDPGGLLRNKFKYQYSRQPQANREQEKW